jgi:hypothetical protein
VRADWFWQDIDPTDPWASNLQILDEDRMEDARLARVTGHGDVEVGVALARLVHGEYEHFGTDGGQHLTVEGSRSTLFALRAVLQRVWIPFDPPFRDFPTFRRYWGENNASGSWQGRRNILHALFEPVHERLADLEAGSVRAVVVEPVSPRGRTGWTAVDEEIAELKRHFAMASSPQDFSNIGNDAVRIIEALSRQAYDPAKHLRDGETEPAPGKTKMRLERYIEDALPGEPNAELRALARATINLTQATKHRGAPTRQAAGIAADAVIMLANLLRRLED